MELIIETAPAVIELNYEGFRAYVEQEITKYDVVVTADTVGDAKKLATDLNKKKGEIAAKRKEVVAAASGPVRVFEDQVKALEKMCEDGRQKILVQVQKFEADTLKVARAELTAYLEACYAKHRVSGEFQAAKVDDLVKLTALTATKALTKASREAVSARVGECVIKQSRTALRLSELENESHRAGLHSSLTREHVAGILFYDDQDYHNNLHQLIIRELERQKETLAKAEKIRIEDEARHVSVAPVPITEPETAQQEEPPAAEVSPAIQSVEQVVAQPVGPTRRVDVSIILSVDAPVAAPLAAIESALRKKLVAAGIEQSIHSIFAAEAAQQGAA